MYRVNARKIWVELKGDIPDGYEVNHIVPVFAGGTNEIENLELLSEGQHKHFHLERYNRLGDFRDLCAYHLIGHNFSEAHRVSSSIGGKIGGKISGRIVRDRKIGICGQSVEKMKLNGYKSGMMQFEKGLGFHKFYRFDRAKHLEIASMGGKKALSNPNHPFNNMVLQSKNGKIGGAKNKNTIWINDGNLEIKIKREELDTYLLSNPSFIRGRLKSSMISATEKNKYNHANIGKKFPQSIIQCPHCEKSGGKGLMKRWHFDNCKKRKYENKIY